MSCGFICGSVPTSDDVNLSFVSNSVNLLLIYCVLFVNIYKTSSSSLDTFPYASTILINLANQNYQFHTERMLQSWLISHYRSSCSLLRTRGLVFALLTTAHSLSSSSGVHLLSPRPTLTFFFFECSPVDAPAPALQNQFPTGGGRQNPLPLRFKSLLLLAKIKAAATRF